MLCCLTTPVSQLSITHDSKALPSAATVRFQQHLRLSGRRCVARKQNTDYGLPAATTADSSACSALLLGCADQIGVPVPLTAPPDCPSQLQAAPHGRHPTHSHRHADSHLQSNSSRTKSPLQHMKEHLHLSMHLEAHAIPKATRHRGTLVADLCGRMPRTRAVLPCTLRALRGARAACASCWACCQCFRAGCCCAGNCCADINVKDERVTAATHHPSG